MLDAFLTTDGLIALVTLTFLEVVLGVDNVIFISILSGKLPPNEQAKARRVGLIAAMVMRILLLLSLAWIIRLTEPLFTLFDQRHLRARSHPDRRRAVPARRRPRSRFTSGWKAKKGTARRGWRRRSAPSSLQIMLLDIVFSLDSVITAVGMADSIAIMVAAVVIAVGIMMFSAEPISAFVNRHPTVKVLALSFLLLIGVSLVGDGFGMHIPKGYIYFAMGFSVFVEMINLRVRKSVPVKLHEPYVEERNEERRTKNRRTKNEERARTRNENDGTAERTSALCPHQGGDGVEHSRVDVGLRSGLALRNRQGVIAAFHRMYGDGAVASGGLHGVDDGVGAAETVARALDDQCRHRDAQQMRHAIRATHVRRRPAGSAGSRRRRRRRAVVPCRATTPGRRRDAWPCGRPSTCRQ